MMLCVKMAEFDREICVVKKKATMSDPTLLTL